MEKGRTKLSVAEIRRAALAIQTQRRVVWAHTLTEQLDATKATVQEYLSGIDGLAKEIGAVNSACARYHAAAALAKEDKALLTKKELAWRLGLHEHAVYEYMRLHPGFDRQIGIASRADATRARWRECIHARAQQLKRAGKVVTQGDFADSLGISGQHFLNLLYADQELKEFWYTERVHIIDRFVQKAAA